MIKYLYQTLGGNVMNSLNEMKYTLDMNDNKKVSVGDQKLTFYRIVALKDFTTIDGQEIKAGDLGGYITRDTATFIDHEALKKADNEGVPLKEVYVTLSQEGRSWIDENSIVGPGCHIGGDAVVRSSLLVKDCYVNNSAMVIFSKLCPNFKISVYGGGKVIGSTVENGNLFVSGAAVLSDCKVEGTFRVSDDIVMRNCDIKATRDGLNAVGKKLYKGMKINGYGILGISDNITMETKTKQKEA